MESNNNRAATMSSCRARALKRLTDNHREEFLALVAQEYDAAGLVVRTRVTTAAAKIAKLQAKISELEQQL